MICNVKYIIVYWNIPYGEKMNNYTGLLVKDNILKIGFDYCSVYFLENTVNRNNYVGATIRLRGRLLDHLKRLRQNEHGNKFLQEEWNRHQQNKFVFGIIEETTRKNKRRREQYYINKLKPEYNKITNVRRGPDPEKISSTLQGRKLSQEHKDKIAQANKNRTWREESKLKNRRHQLNSKLSARTKHKISQSLKGREISEKTKEKISKSHKGVSKNKGEDNASAKLTAKNVKEIKQKLRDSQLTHKEIADMYPVTKGVIDKISEGKMWSHINIGGNSGS